MAIIPTGGKMNHSTVVDASPELSSVSTTTGGALAKSVAARLTKAFPASPIIGTSPSYDADDVSEMKEKILTNTVLDSDIASAAGYYGFTSAQSGESNPSAADLNYTGAPNIPAVNIDTEGNAIASPYMPNLSPPDGFNPNADNETPNVLTLEESRSATTPGIGDGLANPAVTSLGVKGT